MDRKHFLAHFTPLAFASPFLKASSIFTGNTIESNHPPFLQKGDLVGITCPSGHISLEECKAGILQMEDWGFKVCIGNTVGATDFTFAGNDEQRAKDFQYMIDDPNIKAVMLGRGGYGAVRIIDKIDFTKFVKKPKWIIGFSDATVFHIHINHRFNIPTIHSKMCNSFPDDRATATPGQHASIQSIFDCLSGKKMQYAAAANKYNCIGVATGQLIGGNLSVIEQLCGSSSQLMADGKILFIEDTGEYLYKIDGMLWNLKRSGKLKKLKALIVGQFRIKPDDPGDEFGRSLYEIVLNVVKEYNYPVCFDFPVGHVKENYALKCGIVHKLEVKDNGVSLQETFK